MIKQTLKNSAVNEIKDFLIRVGKQVFDNNKCIYYIDYNNKPHKLIRGNNE